MLPFISTFGPSTISIRLCSESHAQSIDSKYFVSIAQARYFILLKPTRLPAYFPPKGYSAQSVWATLLLTQCAHLPRIIFTSSGTPLSCQTLYANHIIFYNSSAYISLCFYSLLFRQRIPGTSSVCIRMNLLLSFLGSDNT